MKALVKEHIESERLFELAQMTVSIDQPDWKHVSDCRECGAAFFMLSLIVRSNSETAGKLVTV
jgi:hypothetical protein